MLAAAAAALLLPLNTASAVASPARAGARPAVLALTMHYEMQCGRPGPGPVVVALPAAERVPRAIARAGVLVDGRAPRSVGVSGHTVTIGLVPPKGITCMVIGPGTLAVSFTRAAGLGNPAEAGSYRIGVRVGARAFTPRLAVRRR
jgi:hypothetical protein